MTYGELIKASIAQEASEMSNKKLGVTDSVLRRMREQNNLGHTPPKKGVM